MHKIILIMLFNFPVLLCTAQRHRTAVKLNGSVGFKTLYPSLTVEYGKANSSFQLEIGGGNVARLKEYQDMKYVTIFPTGGYMIDGKVLECSCNYSGDVPFSSIPVYCYSRYKSVIGKLFYSYYFDISNNRTIGLNGLHIDAGIRYQNVVKKCEQGYSVPTYNTMFYLEGQLKYYTIGPLAQIGYQFIALKWLVIDTRLAVSFNYTNEEKRDSSDPLIGNLFEFSLSIGKVFPYKK
jgi:hypothetical protein